ncbi:MAG: FAD-binding protein [Polyangiales bacterium]
MEQLEPLDLEADVLVIGGGMAACWAALGAARAGAQVVLVDKGYVGTSGVTATGGPGHWWVAPEARAEAIEKRFLMGCGLADRTWMERIIDTTWRTLPTFANYYRFDVNDKGETVYPALRGPEYLRALRRAVLDAGVTLLDHSPALELLVHHDGSIAGARGVRRQKKQGWTARAGAGVLATGGCAFLSGLMGSNTNTGDGYLMAVEAGAELSGMEFSNHYSVSPRWNSTRVLIYAWARYYDVHGNELDVMPSKPHVMARAMREGPVYADLGDAPARLRELLPQIQPATPIPFVRKGVDPFRDRFEVKLFAEGTIRGTGGLRIVDDQCQTSVPGLFAAGDAATRELIAGATSGGGSPNSAWALTSGLFSGSGAARVARERGRRAAAPFVALGGAGLAPTSAVREVDRGALVRAAQDEILPLDKNLFRSGDALAASLDKLDAVWRELRQHDRGEGLDAVAARETAALVATARWCYRAAFDRNETRGMHERSDTPVARTELAPRQLVGGLDALWTRPEAHIGWSPSHA